MSATDPSRSLHRIGPEHNHVVVAAWRERDKAIAERDAERDELDKIREFVGAVLEAIMDDWMGRESMPASECVRRILTERDEARATLRKIAARRPAHDAAAAAFYRCREDARAALTEEGKET